VSADTLGVCGQGLVNDGGRNIVLFFIVILRTSICDSELWFLKEQLVTFLLERNINLYLFKCMIFVVIRSLE